FVPIDHNNHILTGINRSAVWTTLLDEQRKTVFSCSVCVNDNRLYRAWHRSAHEQTLKHQTALMRVHRERLVNAHSNVPDPPPHERNPAQNLLESAAAHLLDSFAHPFGASSHHVSPGRSLSAPPAPINDWHLDDDQFHMMLTPEEEELARAREIAQDIERMLFEDGSESDTDAEPSDDNLSASSSSSSSGDVNNGSKAAPRQLNETLFESPEWFPWPDKVEMANPLVRPHLHFLPEDAGPRLSEARQADRWLRRTAQNEGIWAWDCELNEAVLIFPVVLALLGDNPMQSSTSSRISRGIQQVRQAAVNGVDVIYDRIYRFIHPGKPQRAHETTAQLHSYFADASKLGTQTQIKKARTKTGIKDTSQLHFLEGIFASYKNRRTVHTKQEALDAKLASLPQDPTAMMNPVWRIRGGSLYMSIYFIFRLL
ncbi:hypothetical protein CVT24_012671, partial [Panaeolus cyanescens]